MLLIISVSITKKFKPKSHRQGVLLFHKAWEKYRQNEDVAAAAYAREAVAKFLLAECEKEGLELDELDRRSANKIYKRLCRQRKQKPGQLMIDIIRQLNEVVHLEPTECELWRLLDFVRFYFSDLIELSADERKGGSL